MLFILSWEEKEVKLFNFLFKKQIQEQLEQIINLKINKENIEEEITKLNERTNYLENKKEAEFNSFNNKIDNIKNKIPTYFLIFCDDINFNNGIKNYLIKVKIADDDYVENELKNNLYIYEFNSFNNKKDKKLNDSENYLLLLTDCINNIYIIIITKIIIFQIILIERNKNEDFDGCLKIKFELKNNIFNDYFKMTKKEKIYNFKFHNDFSNYFVTAFLNNIKNSLNIIFNIKKYFIQIYLKKYAFVNLYNETLNKYKIKFEGCKFKIFKQREHSKNFLNQCFKKAENKANNNQKLNDEKKIKYLFNINKVISNIYTKEKRLSTKIYLKLIYLIVFEICPIISIFNSQIKILSKNSNVTLKVSKTGLTQIFSNEICNVNAPTKPNEIYIDKIKQQGAINNIYNLTPDNIVELIWTVDITECTCMFKSCDSIVEINFINFDISKCNSMYGMFRDCHSLTSLNLTLFNTSNVDSMANVFLNCFSLVSLDISSFDTSNVSKYFGHMFCNCTSLKYLNLSKFNTNLVTTIDFMFYGCSNLTSIDLSSFNTSKVIFMSYMFYNCVSLTTIDISHFDTSLVTDMSYLFYNCKLLTSINISNFDTRKTNFTNNMFEGCSSLKYINFSNFDATNVNNMDDMFLNCYNLEYIDLKNFKPNNTFETNYLFKNTSKLLAFCIENKELVNRLLLNDNCLTYSCSENLNEIKKKLITEDGSCTNSCIITNYKFEYNYKCYKECPLNSTERNNSEELEPFNLDSKYFCKPICNEEFPFEMILTQKCLNYCNFKDIINKKCILNYKNEKNNDINIYDTILQQIEELFISDDYDTSYIDNGLNEIFKYEELLVSLTNLRNQKNDKINGNMSTIDLGNCEKILKDVYNISYNETLFMKKIDVTQKGMKIPKIEYDIYSKLNGTHLIKLNISYCEYSRIEIYIPALIEGNLDELNSSSNYYNNLCYTAISESGTDIILNDRKKEFIENNKTLCQENCIFSEYDNETKKVKCSCDIAFSSSSFANMKINKTKLYKNFIDIRNIANINLLVCYKKLFSIKAILHNFGSFILIPIIFTNFIIFIIFYAKNLFQTIKDQIGKISIAINNLAKIKVEEERIKKEKFKKLKIKKIRLNKHKKKETKEIKLNNNINNNKIKLSRLSQENNNKLKLKKYKFIKKGNKNKIINNNNKKFQIIILK